MILYIDCSAGASGDMLLAGWVSLGLPLERIKSALKGLGLSGVSIRAGAVVRHGVHAAQLLIRAGSTGRTLPHRAVKLLRWVADSALADSFKQPVLRVLERLARAEGKVHRSALGGVDFHQLAEVDTLVALLGFVVGMEHFRVRTVYTSPIPIGTWYQGPSGTWHARPAPAVVELTKSFPVVYRPERFEWTTPTAAALLASFALPVRPARFRLEKSGYAVGHRRGPPGPSVLRMWLGA